MQADFAYQPTTDGAGLRMSATILADKEARRAQWHDDVEAAGFTVRDCCGLDEYASGQGRALGDLVIVDCDRIDAAIMATLSRLDMRVEKAGARLIVATVMSALDMVFGCFASSRSHILVDPPHGERVIAIGRAMSDLPGARLREMADEDRLTLLRLTEQVGQLARRLEGLSSDGRPGRSAEGGAYRLESPVQAWSAQPPATHPALPDAQAINQLIKQRALRSRFFEADLFADPAWDILLDLALAKVERRQVSVTSLCIAANVPPTTALRWIGQMVDEGLLLRIPDRNDRRRAHIALSDSAADAMARYFAALALEDGHRRANHPDEPPRITMVPVDATRAVDHRVGTSSVRKPMPAEAFRR